MKRVDMRKIYICEIVRQSKVDVEKEQIVVYGKTFDAIKNVTWTYEHINEWGLFIKTLLGYKHILTGVTYSTPASDTGGQRVVNTSNIEKFAQAERNLAIHFVQKNQSYNLNMLEIEYLEERINNERNSVEEDEK